MIDFSISRRCPQGFSGSSQMGSQCVLSAGHPGPHKTESDVHAERARNMYPTLEDIRRVVREEIRAALQE